jgi:hypothetical protein
MKVSEILNRTATIRGKTNAIFSINYSDIAAIEDLVALNSYVGSIIEKMPKRSMYLLLDVRGLKVDGVVFEHLKKVFERYSFCFKSSAVVADKNNERNFKDLARSLGYTKMGMYTDLDSAKKCLFADEP